MRGMIDPHADLGGTNQKVVGHGQQRCVDDVVLDRLRPVADQLDRVVQRDIVFEYNFEVKIDIIKRIGILRGHKPSPLAQIVFSSYKSISTRQPVMQLTP